MENIYSSGAQGGYDIMVTSTDYLPPGTETLKILPEWTPKRITNAKHDYFFEGWKPSWVDSVNPRYDMACVRKCQEQTNPPPILQCLHDCAYY